MAKLNRFVSAAVTLIGLGGAVWLWLGRRPGPALEWVALAFLLGAILPKSLGMLPLSVWAERRPGTMRALSAALAIGAGMLSFGWVCCAPPPIAPDPVSAGEAVLGVRDTGSVLMSLGRGPCYGACPVYSVIVRGSGRVTFMGARFVADAGLHETTVTSDQVHALLSAFESARFPDLADYPCVEATDLPTVALRLEHDGRVKTVEHYLGCGKAPGDLATLEQAIDSVANTGRWVKGRGRVPARPQ